MIGELLVLVREMRCASMAGLMRQEVSMGQLHVLWLLEHHGTTSMSALADLLGISVSTATGLIDRMEERGLIERIRDLDDRRRVFVRPAAAGRLALEQTEGLRHDRLRAILSRLDERQLRRARLALRDVRAAMTGVADGGDGLAVGGDGFAVGVAAGAGAEAAARAAGHGSHRHYFTDEP
jgi:DNA-binding MarR family transcriptional regulator